MPVSQPLAGSPRRPSMSPGHPVHAMRSPVLASSSPLIDRSAINHRKSFSLSADVSAHLGMMPDSLMSQAQSGLTKTGRPFSSQTTRPDIMNSSSMHPLSQSMTRGGYGSLNTSQQQTSWEFCTCDMCLIQVHFDRNTLHIAISLRIHRWNKDYPTYTCHISADEA